MVLPIFAGVHTMPACFGLSRKTNPGVLVLLHEIDEELCKLTNQPVDPKWYLVGWYDQVGMDLVCGVSLNEIRKGAESAAADPEATEGDHVFAAIAKHLHENYDAKTWREIGRTVE
jgi:hypothetical protein